MCPKIVKKLDKLLSSDYLTELFIVIDKNITSSLIIASICNKYYFITKVVLTNAFTILQFALYLMLGNYFLHFRLHFVSIYIYNVLMCWMQHVLCSIVSNEIMILLYSFLSFSSSQLPDVFPPSHPNLHTSTLT